MDRNSTFRHPDALELLTREHEGIRQLFRDYERLVRTHGSHEGKSDIIGRICLAWSTHSQIEEEIFYPAVLSVPQLDKVIEHALQDHAGAMELIAMLDEMEPGDADFDATVAVLGAWVIPHMDEEQADIFPQVGLSGVDTVSLGRQMASRRRTLQHDVTRLGLPAVSGSVPTWPAACRLVMA